MGVGISVACLLINKTINMTIQNEPNRMMNIKLFAADDLFFCSAIATRRENVGIGVNSSGARKSLPQYRQIIASSWISSAQKGHFFILLYSSIGKIIIVHFWRMGDALTKPLLGKGGDRCLGPDHGTSIIKI